MEIVTLDISKELLEKLIKSKAVKAEDYTIKLVSDNSFDYHTNELWKSQKKVADKEYKKLKTIEYNIRWE